jgi:hypothetical protein
VTLFHHHGGREGEYLAGFSIRQGQSAAGLAWKPRDGQAREIRVFCSTQGVVADGVDPTADRRQRLVYQGSALSARLGNDHRGDDVAYYYPDDIVYHYSIFVRGDDGDWHLQLTAAAKPRSVGFWECPGRQRDDDSSPERRAILVP